MGLCRSDLPVAIPYTIPDSLSSHSLSQASGQNALAPETIRFPFPPHISLDFEAPECYNSKN